MYYGKPLTDSEEGLPKDMSTVESVLIAGCGSCHEVAMLALSHPEAKIAALDMSKASLGYGMLRLKHLGLDKNVKYYSGDLELLSNTPPAPFADGFDMITASGVLHHLRNPISGWRNLVAWLKPGGIMSLGLYSRLARIPCGQLRGEVAQKMEFSPPLFGTLQGTDFVSMIRQPTADELRQIRKHVLSSPQYATLAKKSMGEFKDMLCHPQEHIYTLPEVAGILEHLGLEFLGFMLDDDVEIREEFARRFPKDTDMDNLHNWDKYEQDKPWTFSGMYFFHCRKIDKARQEQLFEKYNAQIAESDQTNTKSSPNSSGFANAVEDGDGDDEDENNFLNDDGENPNDASDNDSEESEEFDVDTEEEGKEDDGEDDIADVGEEEYESVRNKADTTSEGAEEADFKELPRSGSQK